jgi:hypothetical protein
MIILGLGSVRYFSSFGSDSGFILMDDPDVDERIKPVRNPG